MNAEQTRYKVGGYNVNIINAQSENVYVGAFINNGSMNETHETAGINHLLEHIIMNSWSKCKKQSCFVYWDKRPVKMNGHTTITYVKYFINGLRSELANMLKYIFEIVTNPKIDVKMIEDEKKIVMNELYNLINEPSNRLLHKMARVLYNHENVYNFYDGELQLHNLKKFNTQEIIDYYNTVYIPNNVTFYICGKFTETQTVQLLDTCREIIHKPPANVIKMAVNYNGVFSYKQQIIYYKNPAAKNTEFIVFIPLAGPPLTYPEQIRLDIFGSRLKVSLFDILRTQQKLVYGINVTLDNYPYGTILTINGSCVDPNIQQVFREIFAHIMNVKKQVFELDRLDNEKAIYKMQLNDTKITPLILCNFYETQNHLNCNRKTKRTHTFQDMFKIIEKVDSKNVLEILRDLSIDNAVIGYMSRHSANISLASIMPK
jgi:predicted Zn-dependent peptidase